VDSNKLFLGVFFFAAACAPVSQLPQVDKALAEIEAEKQRELVFAQYRGYRQRLNNVAYPILRANTELCGEKVRFGSGMGVINKYSFPKDLRKAAYKIANVDEVPTVAYIAKDSPADRAGFKPGDRIISFNDWSAPIGEESMGDIYEKYQDFAKQNKPIKFLISRTDKRMTLTIEPEKVCGYSAHVSLRGEVNAFADGKRTVFFAGMMEFAKTDEELAIVVGHEIAHNHMGHLLKKQGNALLGSIFDILAAGAGVNTGGAFGQIAAGAFSQEFEAEADYVGLYLTTRAGFSIESAPNFWRRMGVQHPQNIRQNHSSSHPSTPHRFVALEKTVKEIREKKTSGKPLLPDRKIEPRSEPVEDEPQYQ